LGEELEGVQEAMKRTPLKRMSPKRKKQYKAYLILKSVLLRKYPYCQVGTCMNKATQLHHKKGRTGELLTDERWVLPICSSCHSWIHDHANEARRIGLLLA
jgi:hypothetical protein